MLRQVTTLQEYEHTHQSPVFVTCTGADNIQPPPSVTETTPLMLSSAQRAPLVILSFLLARGTQAQTCYYPDQTVEPSHIVCNASAQFSLCCQQGATCLTSGLCFSQWDTSINTGTCTDRTGTDHSCFQQCPLTLGSDHGFHTLYRCNDNKWCCSTGGNKTSCCADGDVELFPLKDVAAVMGGTGFLTGFTIAPMDLLRQTNNKSTAATSSAASATPDPSPQSSSSAAAAAAAASTTTPAAPPRTASDATLKTALAAGLGVGLPLLVALLVALFFLARLLMMIRSSQNNNRAHQKKEEMMTAGGVEVDGGGMSARRHGRQEMESPPSEMPGERALELGV